MTIENASKRVKNSGIIAIIRGGYQMTQILRIGQTLASAGVPVLEVTLNTPNALSAIPALRDLLGDAALVGAGTVRTAKQAEDAIDAGAQFLVSPNFDPASVELSFSRDTLHLPGVATPSEVQNAVAAGCNMVKLFPADVLGGVKYMEALRAPLDDADFVPTGGVGPENIAAYAHAGAAAVGVGSSLIPKGDPTADDIKKRVKVLRMLWAMAQD